MSEKAVVARCPECGAIRFAAVIAVWSTFFEQPHLGAPEFVDVATIQREPWTHHETCSRKGTA